MKGMGGGRGNIGHIIHIFEGKEKGERLPSREKVELGRR